MKRLKKILLRLLAFIIVICVIIGFVSMMINNHVVNSQKDNIAYAITDSKTDFLSMEIDKIKKFEGDCILVLGAGIKDDNTPTKMLKDRLDTALLLYNEGAAPKILVSGDNGTKNHNEIHVMLNYLLNAGVPEEDIFCDHAGFSTYDSMYRAQNIFKVKKAIIVTQSYHLYRSLYVADKLGISVMGIGADQKIYSGQSMREIREVLARVKDYVKVKLKPESSIGGEVIEINGNGVVTHGE